MHSTGGRSFLFPIQHLDRCPTVLERNQDSHFIAIPPYFIAPISLNEFRVAFYQMTNSPHMTYRH